MSDEEKLRFHSLDAEEREYSTTSIAFKAIQSVLLIVPALIVLNVILWVVMIAMESSLDLYGFLINRSGMAHSPFSFVWSRQQIFETVFGKEYDQVSPMLLWTARVSNTVIWLYGLALSFLLMRSRFSYLFMALSVIAMIHLTGVGLYKTWDGISTLISNTAGIPKEPWNLTDMRFADNCLLLALQVYFDYMLSKSLLILWRSRSKDGGAAIAPAPDSVGFLQKILFLFGAPANLMYSKYWLLSAIMAYAATTIGMTNLILVTQFVPIPLTIFTGLAIAIMRSETSQDILRAAIFYTLDLLAMAVVLLLAWYVFRKAASVLQDALRWSLRRSMLTVLALDPRQPILFLRSFADDAVALPEPRFGLGYRIFCFSEARKTLDQVILEEASYFGPVVALGSPTDSYPPYGAARGYFEHATWQANLAMLAHSSRYIVVCVDDSAGIWWELRHIAERGQLGKTLFVLHPKHRDAPALRALFDKIEGALAIAGLKTNTIADSMAARGNVVGFTVADDGAMDVFVAKFLSRASYLVVLRRFIRARAA